MLQCELLSLINKPSKCTIIISRRSIYLIIVFQTAKEKYVYGLTYCLAISLVDRQVGVIDNIQEIDQGTIFVDCTICS
jgi:hypothetical protein